MSAYRTYTPDGIPIGFVSQVDPITGLPLSHIGNDSSGNYLPSDFETLQTTLTRNGTGSIVTEARTNGTNTWTRTYTRDGSDNVTGISTWVKT